MVKNMRKTRTEILKREARNSVIGHATFKDGMLTYPHTSNPRTKWAKFLYGDC